jgi:hypothetical protein
LAFVFYLGICVLVAAGVAGSVALVAGEPECGAQADFAAAVARRLRVRTLPSFLLRGLDRAFPDCAP